LIRFPFLDKEFACAYLVASWPEIDTSIFAIRVPRASEAALQRRALKFAFRGDVYPGQRLLTIGYGGHRNPFLKPMVDLGPDCRVFSGRNDFRFKLEPEYFETDRMQVWSLAHGCEASPGDSGSAILDRVTGEVVAILWATTPGRSARAQDSSYLSSLLESPNDDVWEQLNYAAPALKIFETINATIAVPSDFMDLDRRNTLRALIGMPPEMPGQDPIPDPTPEPTEEPLPEPTDAPAPTEPPVEPVEVPNPPTPTEDPPVVVEPVEPLPPIEPIEVPSTAPSPAPEDQPITAPTPLPLRLPEES
jgi:hypothetical protein